MPRVLSYTPSWLSRPSPGFDMFTVPPHPHKSSSEAISKSIRRNEYRGARRVVARRGTEVFVVVDNTIRWADLPSLKDDFEGAVELSTSPSSGRGKRRNLEDDFFANTQYRTLKPAVHEPIQQLIPSPNNEFVAIVTTHTVHVAILPDSLHLGKPDSGPIRIKTHTLGPTIHVLAQARVVDVLWHPLGVFGQCLITVTADAVVRLWELNRDNRWSYDKPTIDLDLTKLLHASSAEDSVESARIGESKGFSMDPLGMEVASATFGGTGLDGENGWSSMTLWIAMTEGDVYAICPLLPSRWQSPSTQIPSLTTSIVAKKPYAESSDSHEEVQRSFEAQFRWLSELDDQDGFAADTSGCLVYTRPKINGILPRLQGPFRIQPGDLEDDLELADLHVIAPKLNMDELVGQEDEDRFDEPEPHGLSATIVCLMTVNGRVYSCLNLEEIEGQWLPLKKPRTKQLIDPEIQPELVLLEGLDTMRNQVGIALGQPVFTPDILSRYAFFITHREGIFYVSLEPWLEPLEKELRNGDTTGASFRMGVLSKSQGAIRERILYFNEHDAAIENFVTASLLFKDSDLGYFLLTTHQNLPKAVLLDLPTQHDDDESSNSQDEPVYKEETLALAAPPIQPFEPPQVLWDHKTAISSFLDTQIPKRHRSMLKDEVRLSSATLEVLTEAHRVLSQETNSLGLAASEIFTRCSKLQRELQDQLKRVASIAAKVDRINDDDADDYGEIQITRGSARLETRLLAAQEKQLKLSSRLDMLKKKLSNSASKPLSKAEVGWVEEVKKIESAVMPEERILKEDRAKESWQRVEEIKSLKEDLVSEAKEVAGDAGKEKPGNGMKVSQDIRNSKLKQIMELLHRESALVDAAQERLERLSIVGA